MSAVAPSVQMLFAVPAAWLATGIDIAALVAEAGSFAALRDADHSDRTLSDQSDNATAVREVRGTIRGSIAVMLAVDLIGVAVVLLALLVFQPSTLSELFASDTAWAVWVLFGFINPTGAALTFITRRLSQAFEGDKSNTPAVSPSGERTALIRNSARRSISDKVSLAFRFSDDSLRSRLARIDIPLRNSVISVEEFYRTARHHFSLSTSASNTDIDHLLAIVNPDVQDCVDLMYKMVDASAFGPLLFYLRYVPPA